MKSDLFFKNHFLPFAELRFSRSSNASFKPHMHRTLGIGAVYKGEVLYDVNGKKALLSTGSLVVINPETLHSCNPANETGRSYYMLHLDTDWCFQVQRSMWEIKQFVEVEKIRIDDVPLYEQYCKTVEHLVDENIHLQEKEQMLFYMIYEVFSVACIPRVIKKECTDKIKALKRILSIDLHKDYTLDSLAEELGINPYTLIRSFKAVTGITPHAYRMNCRIEHARALLRKGADITETALECGFFDPVSYTHLRAHETS